MTKKPTTIMSIAVNNELYNDIRLYFHIKNLTQNSVLDLLDSQLPRTIVLLIGMADINILGEMKNKPFRFDLDGKT